MRTDLPRPANVSDRCGRYGRCKSIRVLLGVRMWQEVTRTHVNPKMAKPSSPAATGGLARTACTIPEGVNTLVAGRRASGRVGQGLGDGAGF
jgi:hypothetical protein